MFSSINSSSLMDVWVWVKLIIALLLWWEVYVPSPWDIVLHSISGCSKDNLVLLWSNVSIFFYLPSSNSTKFSCLVTHSSGALTSGSSIVADKCVLPLVQVDVSCRNNGPKLRKQDPGCKNFKRWAVLYTTHPSLSPRSLCPLCFYSLSLPV